jgi:hypothetical protein
MRARAAIVAGSEKGQVAERLKARAWKVRNGDEPFEGSNPSLSATLRRVWPGEMGNGTYLRHG